MLRAFGQALTRVKRGKNHAYKVRSVFASHWFKILRENFEPITSVAITFDSRLKTSLQRRWPECHPPPPTSKSDSPLCPSDFSHAGGGG